MRKATIVPAAIAVLFVAFLYFRESDIPRAALEAKYAAAPSQFLRLPSGARAHVRDRGPREGLPLVLIHGSNASFLTWEPWVRRLTDQFRVITFDMIGHGLTGAVPDGDYSQKAMVKFLAELVDVLKLTTFAVGGNSMGGRIAASFAAEYPQRVTHLVLVDASGLPYKEAGATPLAFRIAAIPVLNRMLLHITPRSIIVESLHAGISRKEIITDDMIDSYWDFVRMEGTRAATLARLQRYDGRAPIDGVADRIADIQAPTLILWGEEDSVIPLEVGREFHRLIPGSKLVVYPNTGHTPQEEVAEESAVEVRAFLTRGN